MLKQILAFAALAIPTAGSAHVVFDKPEARAGGYYAGFMRVSHGCGASPTVSLRVRIPEAVASARPQPKPGWALSIEKAPLAQPLSGEGGARIAERVVSVTWTGLLPIDQFEQFGLMMKLPEKAGPLYFPAEQLCQSGANEWTEIPTHPSKWHDLDRPAPMLMVHAPRQDAHAGH